MEFEYREYAKKLFEEYSRRSDPHFAIHFSPWNLDFETVMYLQLNEFPIRNPKDVHKAMCKIEAGPYFMNPIGFYATSLDEKVEMCIRRIEDVKISFLVKIVKNIPEKACIVEHFKNYFLIPPLNKDSGYLWILEEKDKKTPVLSELQPLKLNNEMAVDLMFSII
ncbi:MAG: hypothetical protein NZ894_05860 [Archaeoglobaceae archaeon]|nr:hypothetical protein [Archaeoglobaceae archaeon]